MKYIKKPVIIEAFQYGIDDDPYWFLEAKNKKDVIIDIMNRCIIKTLEGNMTAEKGDFIIQGVKGEIYPCKADIFQQTYKKVEA